MKNVKINFALREFIKKKIGQADMIHKEEIEPYFDYVRDIQKNFILFKEKEADTLLFGNPSELEDLRRSRAQFTIVPLTNEQFDMLADTQFLDLLSSLDVR